MPPRIFIDHPLGAADEFSLPPGPARHVQVLRLQPGSALCLFDGSGAEWVAEVTTMGRSDVGVRLLSSTRPERELTRQVRLAVVMPANDRMDGIVEKATELGASAIQPLMSERSVLRLSGERAEKKRQHWQGVAIAAAEQSRRLCPTRIEPVLPLATWLAGLPPSDGARLLLSPLATQGLTPITADSITVLSGPEGGLSDAEEAQARAQGFTPVALGPRILRADTAPLAVMAWLSLA